MVSLSIENFYNSTNLVDKRSLLHYEIFYKAAPSRKSPVGYRFIWDMAGPEGHRLITCSIFRQFRNVSMFDGKDACSKDIWDLKVLGAGPRDGNLASKGAFLLYLHPWTQYAVYVEAITIKSK